MSYVTDIGTKKHVEDILVLGRLFRAEYAQHLNFDDEWTAEYCRNVMRDPDRIFTNVFIAYKDDAPVGFLVAHAMPYTFTSQILAQQELWYVKPEDRGTRVAYKLIQAFEEWARLRGAVEIFTGVAAGDAATVNKISNVLKRMGYPQVGSYHKKRTV